MNVVVSAIVDPWVTTLSFVVALAMKIQVSKIQNLCTFQARFSGSLFRQSLKRVRVRSFMEPDFLAMPE